MDFHCSPEFPKLFAQPHGKTAVWELLRRRKKEAPDKTFNTRKLPDKQCRGSRIQISTSGYFHFSARRALFAVYERNFSLNSPKSEREGGGALPSVSRNDSGYIVMCIPLLSFRTTDIGRPDSGFFFARERQTMTARLDDGFYWLERAVLMAWARGRWI